MARDETEGSAWRRPATVAGLLRMWRTLDAVAETLAPDDSRLSIVCGHASEVRQVYQVVTSPGASTDSHILARAVTNRADAMLRLFWGPGPVDLRPGDPGVDAPRAGRSQVAARSVR